MSSLNARVRIVRLLSLISFFAAASLASGQVIWSGGAPIGGAFDNNNWSNPLNWSLGVAPSNPTPSVLQFAGSSRVTPNADAAWTAAGLTFNSGASSFTVGGSTLTLNGSGIINSATAAQTVNNALSLGAAQTWNAASGNLTLSGATNTNGNLLTASAGSGSTLAINGDVSGTGSVAISANSVGTVSMTGNNSYSGGTALLSGTLSAGSNTAFGSGPLALGGGTLIASGGRTLSNQVILGGDTTIGGSSDITFSSNFVLVTPNLNVTNTGTTTINGVVSGAAGFNKTGNGAVVLGGVNTVSGTVAINGGSVTVNVGSSLAATSAGLVVNDGTLFFNNSAQTLASLSGTGGTINLGANHTLTLNQASNTTYAGSFGGTGALVKNGVGTLTLSGTVGYTGGTTVSAGTLKWGASNRFADTGPITLNGGTLALNGFSDNIGTLKLSASSTIDFGTFSTGTLAFADSSGQPWGNSILVVTNYTTGSTTLRFGSSSSGLNPAQLADIRFVDYGNVFGQIDAFGNVTPSAIPEPGITAALLGAAALATARWRRRRLASAAASVPTPSVG